MKPTERQWHRAKDMGAQARRNGRKSTENPYRNDHTELGEILFEAWEQGFVDERAPLPAVA
jgi:hypothetical protein